MVGDYFKHNPQLLAYTDDATELITWLRSKTFVLSLIAEAQLVAGEKKCAVLRAVLTRWTAHYVAYRRLLELRQALLGIVIADEIRSPDKKKITTGDAKAKAKACKMSVRIKDPLFWYAIAR